MFGYSNTKTCEDTFKCIFDTYKNRLYGYVLAISHSSYAAEEITQEIFLNLWICRDALGSIDNIEGYIFTIARNKTLNHLRKANHQHKLLQELKDAMAPVVNETEDREAVAELDSFLQEALIRLSPQRRLVYQLSRQEGMNHEQIALHLQLSRNTVKNHLVYSLRFIRNYLRQKDIAVLLLSFFFF